MSIAAPHRPIPGAGCDQLGALRCRPLWAYGVRTTPIMTCLAFGVIGCAWAVASGLDTHLERSILAIVGSVGLAVVLADPAAVVSASAVVPLRRRRVIPIAVGAGTATASWLAAQALAITIAGARSPDRWDVLEWSVVLMTQLAGGAVANRWRPATPSFGPGLFVGVGWYVLAADPRLSVAMFEIADHVIRWTLVLGAAAAVVATSSADPARKSRKVILR